ncbi:MAG: hypothetical protein RDV48_23000 [Candidatus Eremiobacteraeota bacterium]|nr:hypothetical protein [Candidatus Eremiobacteraeota bacterium]
MSRESMLKDDLEQAQALMKILYSRMKPLECVNDENKETLSYRIAEIMTACKNLYTRILPRLLDDTTGEDFWDLLCEMRMHYLNILDIINEFDETFLASIKQEEEEDTGGGEDDDEEQG